MADQLQPSASPEPERETQPATPASNAAASRGQPGPNGGPVNFIWVFLLVMAIAAIGVVAVAAGPAWLISRWFDASFWLCLKWTAITVVAALFALFLVGLSRYKGN